MLVNQMEQRLENLAGRVDRIEQILPTLATKDDLQAAIEPLATKAEIGQTEQRMRTHTDEVAESLRADIGQTEQRMRTHTDEVAESLRADIRQTEQRMRTHTDEVAESLRDDIRQTEQRMRTHFGVVAESLRDDIKLVAAAFESLAQRDR